MENHKLIYLYSCEGTPIYVGQCTNLLSRLKWHYNDQLSPISLFLINLRDENKFPDVQVLEVVHKTIATIKEKEYIKLISSYYPLLNYINNNNRIPKPEHIFIGQYCTLTHHICTDLKIMTPTKRKKIPVEIVDNFKIIQKNAIIKYGKSPS